MASSKDVKTVLGFQNSVPVLIFLLESGGSAKSGYIREAVGNYNSIKSAAQRLSDSGLITITAFGGKSSYILYELTDLGYKVAEDLKRANDRILETMSEDPDIRIDHASVPVEALANKRTENAARGGEEDLLNDDCAKKRVTGGGDDPSKMDYVIKLVKIINQYNFNTVTLGISFRLCRVRVKTKGLDRIRTI